MSSSLDDDIPWLNFFKTNDYIECSGCSFLRNTDHETLVVVSDPQQTGLVIIARADSPR